MYRATSLRHYLEETIKILFMPTFHGKFIMHNTVSIKIPDLAYDDTNIHTPIF